MFPHHSRGEGPSLIIHIALTASPERASCFTPTDLKRVSNIRGETLAQEVEFPPLPPFFFPKGKMGFTHLLKVRCKLHWVNAQSFVVAKEKVLK